MITKITATCPRDNCYTEIKACPNCNKAGFFAVVNPNEKDPTKIKCTYCKEVHSSFPCKNHKDTKINPPWEIHGPDSLTPTPEEESAGWLMALFVVIVFVFWLLTR